MNREYYRFTIGDFACTVISDGYIAVPLMGSEDKDASENLDISCLLVQHPSGNVLLDTGCGRSFQETAGKLVENMRKTGVTPDEIQTIIYTHGHEDHAAGTVDGEGNPVFSNARYIVARKEWESWEAKPETPLNEGLFASARKYLLPMKDRFELAEDDAAPLPGIILRPARGHTLGGVIIEIASGGEKLLCIGDLIHSLTEFDDPARYSFLDADKEAAVWLRTDGLREISEAGSLVYACHFGFPGLGHISDENGRLGWAPVPDTE